MCSINPIREESVYIGKVHHNSCPSFGNKSMSSRTSYVPREQARLVSIYTVRIKHTVHFIYLGNTQISCTEFVYADDKRVHNRKCLLIFVLPTWNDVYEIYFFILMSEHLHEIWGFIYTDAVSNRNGFMTWKPHRKRHFASQPISCQTVYTTDENVSFWRSSTFKSVLKTTLFWSRTQIWPTVTPPSLRGQRHTTAFKRAYKYSLNEWPP